MSSMSAVPGKTESAPTVRVRTLVLKGGRVEVSSPQLKEGEAVEVDIRSASPSQTDLDEGRRRILELIDSLPPDSRTEQEWADYERQFQEQRESWER